MIQALPDSDDEVLTQIENNLRELPSLSRLISSGADATAIIDLIFAGLPSTLYDEGPVEFKCPCSHERIQGVLVSVGEEEIQDILATDGQAEICCHFCGEKYQFEKSDLENVVAIIRENVNK